MNRDDLIKMARISGASPYTNRYFPDRPFHTFSPEQLESFVELVTAYDRDRLLKIDVFQHETKESKFGGVDRWSDDQMCSAILTEREACAKVCEGRDSGQRLPADEEDHECASAIRSRGTP